MNTYKNNLIKQKARYKTAENPSYIQYNDVILTNRHRSFN